MNAPDLKPEERVPAPPVKERHLAVAPPTPPRRAGIVVAIALSAAFALLVGGGVYAWQHAQVADKTAQLASVKRELQEAQAKVYTKRWDLYDLKRHYQSLAGRVEKLDNRMRNMYGRLARVRAGSSGAHARTAHMSGLVGPKLPNGGYEAAIYAIGAGQSPPRLLVGIPLTNPTWRLLEVRDRARVTLIEGGDVGRSVSFDRFGMMFERHPALRTVYQLALQNGRVTQMEQLGSPE